jgi:Spy/CpxP family protein refolding chaperone
MRLVGIALLLLLPEMALARKSAEQKVKVRELREASRTRVKALREELHKRRAELNERLDRNAEDEALRQAFQELQETKAALEKARFERMLAIRSVLSEQQRASFQNLRQRQRAARAPRPDAPRRE